MTAQAWFEWGVPITALVIGIIGFSTLALQSRVLDKTPVEPSHDREDKRRLAR
jgi:hypothetical protein